MRNKSFVYWEKLSVKKAFLKDSREHLTFSNSKQQDNPQSHDKKETSIDGTLSAKKSVRIRPEVGRDGKDEHC